MVFFSLTGHGLSKIVCFDTGPSHHDRNFNVCIFSVLHMARFVLQERAQVSERVGGAVQRQLGLFALARVHAAAARGHQLAQTTQLLTS